MAKSVLHDDAMVQLLKDSPNFAPLYLHQAFIEIDEEAMRRSCWLYAMSLKPLAG